MGNFHSVFSSEIHSNEEKNKIGNTLTILFVSLGEPRYDDPAELTCADGEKHFSPNEYLIVTKTKDE